MKLNLLVPIEGSVKNRKRVGRGHGSGLGRSSGRGDKGAGQRSGFKRRPWFEGGQMSLARRLPKRGFTSIFKKEFQIINLEKIDALGLTILGPEEMLKHGLIRSSLKPVKIHARGDLEIRVEMTASAFSGSATLPFEKAGGTAIQA